MPVTVRRPRWPEDFASINSMDLSFSSDYVYHLSSVGMSFSLTRDMVSPRFQKRMDIVDLAEEIQAADRSNVVDVDGVICGVAAIVYESWNRRAVLRHLYVPGRERRKGYGRRLVTAMADDARGLGARCLWIETQNTNDPAIQFYLRNEFRLCGLDQSLYDLSSPGRDECALFFVRDLVKVGVTHARERQSADPIPGAP